MGMHASFLRRISAECPGTTQAHVTCSARATCLHSQGTQVLQDRRSPGTLGPGHSARGSMHLWDRFVRPPSNSLGGLRGAPASPWVSASAWGGGQRGRSHRAPASWGLIWVEGKALTGMQREGAGGVPGAILGGGHSGGRGRGRLPAGPQHLGGRAVQWSGPGRKPRCSGLNCAGRQIPPPACASVSSSVRWG